MKKRILSLLLAAMMVISIFVMPTSVSAAEETYSWDGFAANDYRTNKASEGQLIDVGAKGEVANTPTVDGVLTSGEYNVSANLAQMKDPSKTVKSYYAVKDGFLYIAVNGTNSMGTDRKTVQFDLGVGSAPTSEQAYTRLAFTINSSGVLSATRGTSVTFYNGAAYASTGLGSVTLSDYVVDHGFKNGVYEIKVDLGNLYRLFANLPGGTYAWDNPTVNFTFWNLTGGEYHHSIDSKTNGVRYQNGGRAVDWLPYVIILPDASLKYIQGTHRGVVGELGKDWRNLVPGQLLRVEEYATTAPTVDGAVGANEYTDSYVITPNYGTITYSKVTASYSVKDGFVYGALVYDEATPTKAHLQMGLNNNTGTMVWGRLSGVINTNGTYTGHGGLYKHITAPTVWCGEGGTPTAFNGAGWSVCRPVVASAFKNVNGVTTVEFQASIPAMVAAVEQTGYNPSEANCFKLMFWPGQKNMLGWTYSNDQLTSARQGSAWTDAPGYVCPTVELPKGCVEQYRPEKYYLDDVDDFDSVGQVNLNAAPSVVTLDGKIGGGEYTSKQVYDKLRSSDGVMVPDVSISGTNYFAYDEEYLYFGAQVKDTYVDGKSSIQLNLGVPNNHVTGKFDLGDGVTRVGASFNLKSDGTVSGGSWGVVMRSQTCYNTGVAATTYVGQAEFNALAKENIKSEAVASYDEKNGIITYEIKVGLDGLATLFGVEKVEAITYLNYVVLGNGTYGWNLYKIPTETHEYAMAILQTGRDNGTAIKYSNNFYGNVVNLNRDFATRDGASVRISNTVSGLRFKTHYTDTYLAEMAAYAESKGVEMEVGTLIAPKDYITGEFTHAALGAGRYVEVMADTTKPFANANGVTTFAGSIVNIKEANLGRDFAGIGFIKIGSEYFYSDVYSVKNVSSIASAALTDVQATSGNGYVHPVEGGYSPYSAGQRTILSSLIAK